MLNINTPKNTDAKYLERYRAYRAKICNVLESLHSPSRMMFIIGTCDILEYIKSVKTMCESCLQHKSYIKYGIKVEYLGYKYNKSRFCMYCQYHVLNNKERKNEVGKIFCNDVANIINSYDYRELYLDDEHLDYLRSCHFHKKSIQ